MTFAFSGIGRVNFNIKIRNEFIEIRYCISNIFVIFVTNYGRCRIQEVIRNNNNNNNKKKTNKKKPKKNKKKKTDFSLNILGKSINLTPLQILS